VTPGYLIWQAEHQNEHLQTTAQARAERAAATGVPVRRRRRWSTSTAGAVLGLTRPGFMTFAGSRKRGVTRLAGETEVRCP
jgi:hypothetical protein